jgi:hypothetical protein
VFAIEPLDEHSADVAHQAAVTFGTLVSVAHDDGMQNEQEIATIAHWVQQHRGSDAPRYVAEQIQRLTSRGDQECMQLWQNVATHFQGANGQSTLA